MRQDALSRKQTTMLVLLLVALATLLPICASVLLARRQARVEQEQRALFYALDVMRRSEDTGRQADAAFRALAGTHDPAPCGAATQAVLQRFDAASKYLQFVGLLDGNRVSCASYGKLDVPLDLGKPDLVSARGYKFWLNLQFPFAPGDRFIGLGSDRYVAIIHKSLPVDTTLADSNVSLAIISLTAQRSIATRGPFQPEWMPKPNELAPGEQRARLIGSNVVAQIRSRYSDTVAIAALDSQSFISALMPFLRILVPLGVGIGLLLAYVVLRVAKGQRSMPTAIRSGLRNQEFSLVYQPVVRLHDRRWVGAEVLIRWKRPGGHMIPPDLFIPVAEKAGLIQLVTAEVLRLAEPTLAVLAQRDDAAFLSVNLSRQDLQDGDVEILLDAMLARNGALPSQLHLEITERGLAEVHGTRAMIDRLRAKGMRVSVDDFGTGYSSLSELVRFNLDTLKIDKTFVDTIDNETVTSQVAAHIVELAHDLSLGMIAEGVERESQAEILKHWGVQHGQGYLFAKPMDSESFLSGLARQDAGRHSESSVPVGG